MKKILTLSLAVLFCAFMGLAACGGQKEDAKKTYTLELSETSLSLGLYEKYTVTAAVKDEKGGSVETTLVWTASDANVLAVDGGEILAKGLGTASLTVSSPDYGVEGSISVAVSHSGYIPALLLAAEDELSIAEGQVFDLAPSVTFKGVDATDEDTVFSYLVSDPSVATVENGRITALKSGSTAITVTAFWRGIGGENMIGSEDALGLKVTLNLTVKTV